MNRFFKLSVLFLFYNLSVLAQVPKGINYQGVARFTTGTPIAAKTISIKISLLQNSPTGTIEYAETHQPTTNEFGLFTLVIGQGTVTTGNFDFISWANGNKWLQIEMDPEGGGNYSLIGSQQLMSVPYSYYAQYAGNSLKAGPGLSIENNIISNTGDNDNNPSNEINTSVVLGADKVLRITDAGGTQQADLSVLEGTVQNLSQVLSQGADAGGQKISNLGIPTNSTDAATKTYVDNHVDADASSTNEIQDLNLTGNNLVITKNGAATPINLAPYLDNTDNQNLTLSPVVGTNRTVNISNGTNVTFDVADNDNSATNEIQALTKTGGQISLSNGGGTVTLNDDSNTNEIQTLSKAGATISLTSGGSVTLNDDSNSNELQDLNRVGNTLSLTGDVTTVDLTSYLDNTDGQTLATQFVDPNTRSVAITGGNIINVDVRDADANATNELQDLSLAANTLSLSNDATTINLAPYLDNTDNQNLSLTTPIVGTNRTINISNGTNVTFDVADNDNNSANEIQDLSLAANTLTLTNDATTVNLAPYLDNTDNQDLSLAGNTLSLTNDATPINLTPYLDNTDNQDLTLTGNTLSLINDATTINLAPYLDNTDNQTLSQVLTQGNSASGSKITNLGTPTLVADATTKQYVDNLDAADLDKSLTNEIQNLTYTPGTNNLAISGGNNVTITHTLGQVLTTGNDAGGLRIQNLGSPTGTSDATTKQYVDNADALLSSRISTTYSFKTAFSYTNSSGTVANNQQLPFTIEEFDDFNVLASNLFTTTENGVYVFMVDGSYLAGFSGGQLSLLYNSIKYPISVIQPWGSGSGARFNATLMFKLTAGQTVRLIGDNILDSAQFNGTFFGYKL